MSDLATLFEPVTLEASGYRFGGFAAGPAAGPLVLLLHGWPEFADSWTEIARGLGNDGYRAVAIDQRGYGPGARPAEVAAYGIEPLVADVLAFADALGRERFHLVAHDWGAILGWFAAVNHTDRVASFTSLATPHVRALAEAKANDPDQQKRTAYVDFFKLPGNVAEQRLLSDGATPLRKVYEGKFPAAHVDENVRRLSEPGALTATLNWYRAFDFNPQLGPATVPTLFVWGSNDRALGERAARNTAQYVTGPYRFEVLEGVSHWIPVEVPERVLPLLRDHLSAHPL
jgi:pimeloyl-ACP methyl ester carboxylesterase